MKSILKAVGLLILASGLFFMSSCRKDKYQPKGYYQPAGDYGNTAINSFTFLPDNWMIDDTTGNNFQYVTFKDWSGITQSVIDNGAVMAYIGNGTAWIALPVTTADSKFGTLSFSYIYSQGSITILLHGYDLNVETTPNDFSGLKFKIVTITGVGLGANPELDYTNYTEVKKAFNLKD